MSNLVFEKISQALTAAQRLEIGIAGSFLRLSECAWPVTVTLLKGGRVIGSMSNMQAGDYVNNVEFDGVWLVNGATAQTVGIQISGGGAGSNRVLGEVSVIDGGKFRTLSGMAFSWAAGCGAVAGQFAKNQIFNPAGSGKNIVVKAYSCSVPAASTVFMHVTNAPLATLSAAIQATKMASLSGPVAVSRSENAASITASPRYIDYVQFSAAGIYGKVMQEPIVLIPGWGLVVEQSTVNTTVNTVFEWIEESQ